MQLLEKKQKKKHSINYYYFFFGIDNNKENSKERKEIELEIFVQQIAEHVSEKTLSFQIRCKIYVMLACFFFGKILT